MQNLLKDRVEARLKALAINPFQAARDGKLERNFVNDILQEKKLTVRGPNLVKLGQALRCPPAYFIDRDFELHEPDLIEGVPTEVIGETVSIPEYDVRLSAGGGKLIEAENIKDYWVFSRRYLESELRLNIASLAVVEVEGDSMYPTLWSGDRVLVDHGDRNPAKPGVYAVWDSDATVVKRLEKIPASDPPMVVLISDNKNHNAYTVPAELVTIIGRVVWYARRL